MVINKFKKSQEGSINVIVIIILGTLVAAAGTYFIYLGRTSTGSIDMSNAKSMCEIECFKLRELPISTPPGGWGELGAGSSCPIDSAPIFCEHTFQLGDRELGCYDVTDCVTTLSDGKVCKVTRETCGR